jgi:hypothetical protein
MGSGSCCTPSGASSSLCWAGAGAGSALFCIPFGAILQACTGQGQRQGQDIWSAFLAASYKAWLGCARDTEELTSDTMHMQGGLVLLLAAAENQPPWAVTSHGSVGPKLSAERHLTCQV